MTEGEFSGELRLEPFAAVTYTDLESLPEVTCPPYDVISSRAASEFEAADRHNVVRLILPRDGAHDDRYAHAADELHRWLAAGVLRQDPRPALYVYEHAGTTGTALGLVGAVSLTARILPHEDTFPVPVADRAALMSATRAQFEPILLTYGGGGAASDVVDNAVAGEPYLQMDAGDGERHRIWRIDDADQLAVVRADLAPREALIADGHHRFAAYHQVLRRATRPSGEALGLAMLVDATRHPLELRAIHRHVTGLSLDRAIEAARPAFDVSTIDVEGRKVPAALADAADDGGTWFALGDHRRWVLLRAGEDLHRQRFLPAGHSVDWFRLDATVLTHALLGDAWGIDDADARVSYHHEAGDAMQAAQRGGGVTVLVNPPRLADVVELAARGERMPRKSTSFGPKPRTGLLMRLIDW
ncbi:MAG TPA: DUF1015 domain-containing protein [Jiangellaceae bacterium]|nr:DUF1015 domain-containing protein [Jiangellaceae bacterium]